MDPRTFANMFELLLLWSVMLPECGKAADTTKAKARKSTINQKEEQKKKRFRFKYNPHKGYEPYWVGGEYIMTTTTPKPGTTTTVAPKICDYDCNYIYQKIPAVCAIWVDSLPGVDCWSCKGKPGLEMAKAYKTYSFCDFLAEQCKLDLFGDKRLMFVHVGPCMDENQIMKPFWDPWQPVSRMQWYVNSFDKQEDPLNTTPMMSTTRPPQEAK